MSFSTFRKRIGVLGSTSIERNTAIKAREFELWFAETLNKSLVDIDGVEQYAVFQDMNQNNNKDLSDDKLIIVEKDSNLRVGSYVHWRDHIWMVFTEEEKTIPTHKQAKVKESNHYIKWMIGNQVSGNGQGYPAFIQNQTLYTLGVSTSGNHNWIVNAKMMMYMQDNEETRAIKIGQRIFIGGCVYQVMFKDIVSRQGLINYLLEEDFINPNIDNVELEIANYYDSIDDGITEQEPEGALEEVIIKGYDKARIGSTIKLDAEVYKDGSLVEDGISDWTIADVDGVATIVEQTPNYIKLEIEKNFKKVGSTISVIGKTTSGTFGSKTVNIISPY